MNLGKYGGVLQCECGHKVENHTDENRIAAWHGYRAYRAGCYEFIMETASNCTCSKPPMEIILDSVIDEMSKIRAHSGG